MSAGACQPSNLLFPGTRSRMQPVKPASARKLKFLVVGATGHVGSQVAVGLADMGHDVTALVRQKGSVIQDPHQGKITCLTGDLADKASLRRAGAGIDVVISTANGVVPQRGGGDAGSVNDREVCCLAPAEPKASLKVAGQNAERGM